MNQYGWFIATLHSMLGHDTAAAFIGVPPGPREDCVICQYEADPTDEKRQAVYTALKASD
jgi:hypothetical protein